MKSGEYRRLGVGSNGDRDLIYRRVAVCVGESYLHGDVPFSRKIGLLRKRKVHGAYIGDIGHKVGRLNAFADKNYRPFDRDCTGRLGIGDLEGYFVQVVVYKQLSVINSGGASVNRIRVKADELGGKAGGRNIVGDCYRLRRTDGHLHRAVIGTYRKTDGARFGLVSVGQPERNGEFSRLLC